MVRLTVALLRGFVGSEVLSAAAATSPGLCIQMRVAAGWADTRIGRPRTAGSGASIVSASGSPGVSVREFNLDKPHGRVDYLLFLDGHPAGVIEAKPEGTPLVEVERQSGKYVEGLPDWMRPRSTLTPAAAASSPSTGPRP
jgi:type I site-specific restriction endonuclease